LGLCIGSFINVCVWRIPKNKSIIYPFSHCPHCLTFLKWHDNIPLISYFILKGKCRYCGGKISLQYLVIELVTGLTFFLFYLKFGLGIKLFFSLILTIFLIIASGIDFSHRIIPDKLNYSLIFIGLSFSFFNPFLHLTPYTLHLTPRSLHITRFLYALCSMLIAGAFLYLLGLLGEKIFKKEAMGGGDIKLLAGIATFVGIENIFWIIFIASLSAAIAGVLEILFKKKEFSHTLPFAPYLSLGTFTVLLLRI